MNEIRKVVSAPELMVLQFVHGGDAVMEVEFHESKKIDLRDEKDRLKSRYNETLGRKEQSIDGIFGALGVLPQELPQEMLDVYDIYDEDDVVEIARAATKKAKSNTNNNANGARNPTEQQRLDAIKSPEEVSLAQLAE